MRPGWWRDVALPHISSGSFYIYTNKSHKWNWDYVTAAIFVLVSISLTLATHFEGLCNLLNWRINVVYHNIHPPMNEGCDNRNVKTETSARQWLCRGFQSRIWTQCFMLHLNYNNLLLKSGVSSWKFVPFTQTEAHYIYKYQTNTAIIKQWHFIKKQKGKYLYKTMAFPCLDRENFQINCIYIIYRIFSFQNKKRLSIFKKMLPKCLYA